MSIAITRLKCHVTVRTSDKAKSPLHHEETAPRPALLYALPNAPVAMETGPNPAHTPEGEREKADIQNEPTPAARPRRADPRLVADRVYSLMQEEVRLSRLRGGR